ncbi:MAG: 50S ribosomal protein L4 [Chloroflexi bacterium]|nr:50S ribosomal protein L4 [Chloroflexota bacterium]
MQLPVYNLAGEIIEEVELSDAVFGLEPSVPLMHQAVVRHLANRRQGTHSTQTRGDLDWGGRKPWRQKGTGRARQGSTAAPHWTGGGVAHGPKPRDYNQRMPKKMRRQAIRSALSAKAASGQIRLLQDLHFEQPQTREMAALLERLGVRSALVVLPGVDRGVVLSARNLPRVKTLPAPLVNVLDVLHHEHLVLPVAAARVIEGWLGPKDVVQ